MAHNTSDLPWEALTASWEPNFVRLSNLKLTHTPSTIQITYKKYQKTHQSLRYVLPDLVKFAQSFRECAVAEALRLTPTRPTHSKRTKLTDIIISKAVARRITPHVRRYRASLPEDDEIAIKKPSSSQRAPTTLCTHSFGISCGCILPLPYTRLAAFCPRLGYDHCIPEEVDASDVNRKLSGAILAILLTQNEIQPILAAVGSADYIDPMMGITTRGDSSWLPDSTLMFKSVLREAVRPYITLNALCQMRETWHPAAKLQPWHDYRDTDVYQQLVTNIKGRLEPELGAVAKPYHWYHRRFFEMPEAWSLMPFMGKRHDLPPVRFDPTSGFLPKRLPLGTMPYASFAGSNRDRRAKLKWVKSKFQAPFASKFLHDKGLPMEIVDVIISLANDSTWDFVVPDDPLNNKNRPVLLRYLQHCWDTIVLCTLLLGRHDMEQTLEDEVFVVLDSLPRKYTRNP